MKKVQEDGVNVSKEESGRNAGEKSIVDCGEGLSLVGEQRYKHHATEQSSARVWQ